MESSRVVGHFERRDPMQQSLLHQTLNDDRLKEMKTYEELLKKFTTYEIIRWDELAGRKHYARKSRNTLPPVVAITKNKRK